MIGIIFYTTHDMLFSCQVWIVEACSGLFLLTMRGYYTYKAIRIFMTLFFSDCKKNIYYCYELFFAYNIVKLCQTWVHLYWQLQLLFVIRIGSRIYTTGKIVKSNEAFLYLVRTLSISLNHSLTLNVKRCMFWPDLQKKKLKHGEFSSYLVIKFMFYRTNGTQKFYRFTVC